LQLTTNSYWFGAQYLEPKNVVGIYLQTLSKNVAKIKSILFAKQKMSRAIPKWKLC
jgi:hypothetical protein